MRSATSILPGADSRVLDMDFTATPATEDAAIWQSGQRPLFSRRRNLANALGDEALDYFWHEIEHTYGAHPGAVGTMAFWNGLVVVRRDFSTLKIWPTTVCIRPSMECSRVQSRRMCLGSTPTCILSRCATSSLLFKRSLY